MAREDKIRMKFEVEDWEFGMTGSGQTELVFQDSVQIFKCLLSHRRGGKKPRSARAKKLSRKSRPKHALDVCGF